MWWDSPLPPRSFLLCEMTPQLSVPLSCQIDRSPWPPLMHTVPSGSRGVVNLGKACSAVGLYKVGGIVGAGSAGLGPRP